jgi:hypothetical protein
MGLCTLVPRNTVVGRKSDSENKTQTQVVGGQHPGSLPKWLWDFYASECKGKQAGRTKADMAVSLLLGGYNISL